MAYNVQFGKWGESLAVLHLTGKGYQIVERNWRCRFGEIDMIMMNQSTYVFVEVKTRLGRAMGLPEEGLTQRKIEQIVRLAGMFLGEKELDVDWQLDFVAVEADGNGRLIRLEHIPNVYLGW